MVSGICSVVVDEELEDDELLLTLSSSALLDGVALPLCFSLGVLLIFSPFFLFLASGICSVVVDEELEDDELLLMPSSSSTDANAAVLDGVVLPLFCSLGGWVVVVDGERRSFAKALSSTTGLQSTQKWLLFSNIVNLRKGIQKYLFYIRSLNIIVTLLRNNMRDAAFDTQQPSASNITGRRQMNQ